MMIRYVLKGFATSWDLELLNPASIVLWQWLNRTLPMSLNRFTMTVKSD